MRRCLLTYVNEKCPFGCEYCFSRFTQYDRSQLKNNNNFLKSLRSKTTENVIVYPACDYDLFALQDISSILEPLVNRKLSISLSTKAVISQNQLNLLDEYNRHLLESKRTLRVGVSISTKYNVTAIEPGASDYTERIESLMLLKKNSIVSILVIKPILIDIPLTEYYEIIDDCKDYVDAVLLGMEYLDTSRKDEYQGFVSSKRVNWLPHSPVWYYRCLEERSDKISEYALQKNSIPCFFSDMELIAWLETKRINH